MLFMWTAVSLLISGNSRAKRKKKFYRFANGFLRLMKAAEKKDCRLFILERVSDGNIREKDKK